MMSAPAADGAPPLGVQSERRIHIVQGEYHVTADPGVVLTTILGSCVAACIRDPVAGVGGMNHFLLPGGARNEEGDCMRYGVHSMELLVNALLGKGARRDRLEAKLFGGGRMMQGLTDVGASNSAFAEDFLRNEGIVHLGGSLRGNHGRRIQYWAGSGRARQVLLRSNDIEIWDAERQVARKSAPSGALELF